LHFVNNVYRSHVYLKRQPSASAKRQPKRHHSFSREDEDLVSLYTHVIHHRLLPDLPNWSSRPRTMPATAGRVPMPNGNRCARGLRVGGHCGFVWCVVLRELLF